MEATIEAAMEVVTEAAIEAAIKADTLQSKCLSYTYKLLHMTNIYPTLGV